MNRVFTRFMEAVVIRRARCWKRSRTRCFLHDVRGGTTGIVAGTVTVMCLGASALIVDHNWLIDQRDVLKSASDAAAIAATIEMKRLPPETPDDALQIALQEVAQSYVALNFEYLPDDRRARARETLEIEVMPQRDQDTVDVAVRADLGGTLFARHLPLLGSYGGPEEMGAVAKVDTFINPVEVVLAIDLSGSMGSPLGGSGPGGRDPRIDIVKRAARDLVAILDPNETNRVAVGVVPWHIVVRLDAEAREEWARNGWAVYPRTRHYAAMYLCGFSGCSSLAADQSLPAAPGETWRGCVDEHRASGGHAAHPPVPDLFGLPSDNPFAQLFFPGRHGIAYQCLRPPLPSNFVKQSCYDQASADRSRRQYHITHSPQVECDHSMPAILPLTNDRAAVEEAIDGLASGGPKTYSALGVLWGQRLLSKSWNGVWGGGTHPVDSDTVANSGTRKAIVLLTDGEDNVCGDDPSCTERNLGVSRATACTAAKAEGTEIFVIAAMRPSQVSEDLGDGLRACSSEADYPDGTYVFVNNPDAASIEAAFAEIAEQLRIFRRVH